RLQSGRGEAGLYPRQTRLVRQLLEQEKPVVLVTFGNPYAVTTFSTADAFLVAYDQTLESVRTAADILRGLRQPEGKLPITVDPYPFGSGLSHL
ncbi:MAG TPA: glycoside hydrolase family 3 C-terminal domain-containing protein, partial [Rhodothermales bacterium]|nr:glycoside hydrolase family 3 C-terminal domain-containing protein [Rhodothermales bacterium]